MARTPVLWQIKISHYNEKARWALDYKGVPHRRRSPTPLIGTLPTAWVLSRGTTFPILRIDRQTIADSTRIIAALEERFPEPPLYPAEPTERDRALALEDHFDEQLAPQVRLLVWYETMKDHRAFLATAMPDSGAAVRGALRLTAPAIVPAVRRRYGAGAENAAGARKRVMAAMDRLESEIGPAGYLAGDSFSVADLTAAALFTPLLRPPEHPYLPAAPFPEPLQSFCDELARRRGAEWVLDTYRRHRGAYAEAGPPRAATPAAASPPQPSAGERELDHQH